MTLLQPSARPWVRSIAVEAPEEELTGCNTRAELAYIERLWQQRRRYELMLSGVSMIAPPERPQ